ncbi:MAG: S-methyl-5-thioribose-1-phosphate isomerase [Chloroflexia bacterium]|nr:S-methyl-5-thioribose-1-phosphate isomerase [Chloroflexia bacterium]
MDEEMRCFAWRGDVLHLLDQTRLPQQEEWLECHSAGDVARAIVEMRVRGAPAIGIAAAFGVALAALRAGAGDSSELMAAIEQAGQTLVQTRPTAVNLAWAVQRMQARAQALKMLDPEEAALALLQEARTIAEEDEAANRRMGMLGQALLPAKASVLTHCNAGALATGGYGTAVGMIRAAHEQGKEIHVFVGETRPFLQGARLTAWELQRLGIPFTLITDSMAGHFMRQGQVDAVIVGADRIAANGDVANKIGTYSLAVLAFAHGIPFYSVAPTSTLDLSLSDGAKIPLEQRSPREVTHIGAVPVAPEGAPVAHPAFDSTPHRYVNAIVTERGVARAPYEESLRRLVEEA